MTRTRGRPVPQTIVTTTATHEDPVARLALTDPHLLTLVMTAEERSPPAADAIVEVVVLGVTVADILETTTIPLRLILPWMIILEAETDTLMVSGRPGAGPLRRLIHPNVLEAQVLRESLDTRHTIINDLEGVPVLVLVLLHRRNLRVLVLKKTELPDLLPCLRMLKRPRLNVKKD